MVVKNKAPDLETPGLRGQLSALYCCEGVEERHSAIQNSSRVAMVPLLNCSLEETEEISSSVQFYTDSYRWWAHAISRSSAVALPPS